MFGFRMGVMGGTSAVVHAGAGGTPPGGGSWRAGDVLLAGSPLAPPEWLRCDGATYALGLYPELDAIFETGGSMVVPLLTGPSGFNFYVFTGESA